jgi:uncharacterized protein
MLDTKLSGRCEMQLKMHQITSMAGKTIREVLTLRWRPGRELLAVLLSYLLVVVALLVAFQVFTIERVAANFLTFGPLTLVGLGLALPVGYTLLVRRRPLADLGIHTRWLAPSLLIGLLLGWDTYRNTLAALNIEWAWSLLPVALMTLAVGIFEAVFFRGWLQLRFEAAFGILPGLVLGAACYALYHIGYGMQAGELLVLFGLGLVFGAAFRLTRNIAVLVPFYTPIGGLYTNLKEGLTMPFEASYGFILVLVMMAALVTAAAIHKRSPQAASARIIKQGI